MPKENVLIVEDDADIREGVRILLESENYNVKEAANGMEGLKLLDEDTDLVILDIMMPGMSGLRTCEEIRQESADEYLEVGNIRIHKEYNEIYISGEQKELSNIEYRILLLMMQHPGRIFSAQNLYESVWEEPYFYSCNGTVMVHIRKLRVKIEKDPRNPKHIQTVWGKGYRFDGIGE